MHKKHRRTFLQQLVTGSAGLTVYPWLANMQYLFEELDQENDEEKYWKKIRKQYTVSKKYINLNNAGVNPQPKVVQEAVKYYESLSNEIPSYYMWRVIDKERYLVKEALAALVGCQKDDLALMRNTTEAMETIIFGLPLKKGDEIVLSKHDYPHMKFAWKQREARDGIVLKWVNPKMPNNNPMAILTDYKKQISNKTKLVCITHITNWNGQVLPLKEIASFAKSQGAEVLVDAAHTVGQRPLDIQSLDVDYLASSLHKWLGAPFGTGMLYVRKGKRKNVFPLFAGPSPYAGGMHKFEHLGTRASSHERAILPAIVFCNNIGVERKMKRLQYLKTYIVERIKDLPGINIQSPTDTYNGSAILLLDIEGVKTDFAITQMMRDWNIHSTFSKNENLHGIRISPNVYTQLSELDTFVDAIHALTKGIK